MAKVLMVKANDRPADQSVSVRMHDAFLHAYQDAHPDDQVEVLDLYQAEVVLLNARDGNYSIDDMAPYEMAITYMRNIVGLWGIRHPEGIVIEGHHQHSGDPLDIMDMGLRETTALAIRF
ncbi:FMN-dependent NADH-azoreductase [Paenibacillus rhizosphaerae]|uniref:FMN-dependent NADH-azoreductase n=1 Tax=Paenibacillus rhizosphaerae TaxID=297318 RepID=A0A839TJ52_9BACL|nr:NAD(P)H-dependent oxidoreductase [Paenibacillus rhizosphaerae]MBB3125418.1 FMN-dependent NADH-azoreductase [Paenibacillus rhizosphaerae]